MMIRSLTCLIVFFMLLGSEAFSSIGDLKKAVDNEPENSRLLSELAHEYFKEGYYTDAIGALKRIIKLDNETSGDILLLVQSLIRKNPLLKELSKIEL